MKRWHYGLWDKTRILVLSLEDFYGITHYQLIVKFMKKGDLEKYRKVLGAGEPVEVINKWKKSGFIKFIERQLGLRPSKKEEKELRREARGPKGAPKDFLFIKNDWKRTSADRIKWDKDINYDKIKSIKH